MFAQFLALGKRLMQFLDDGLLLGRELERMLGIHCREIGIEQLIFLAVNLDDALLQIHLVKQQAVLHVKVGPTLDGSCLEFELDDADGLVHLCHELGGTCPLGILGAAVLGQEALAGIAGIGVHRKGGQGQQVDAVAVLEHAMIAVAQRYAQHIGNAAVVAGSSTHPQDIVVSPLDIEVVETAQDVHDLVRAGATIIHVSQNVQYIDSEVLDKVAHGNDEVIGPMRGDDGADNHIDVGLLVGVAAVLMHELLDDVGEVLGQCLVHLGAAILGRDVTAYPHQSVDGDEIPVIEFIFVGDFFLDQFQFLGRIVDKRAQVLLLTRAKRVIENLAHLALDGTAGIAQHVLES